MITGGAGYIGSVLREKLPDAQWTDKDMWDMRTEFPFPWGFEPEIDVVVHLGAEVKVGESVKDPWLYYDTNVNGTKHIIDAFPNAKFIFASTGAAFNPTSPYGMSKRMAEDIVKQKCKEFTIFRFFNVGGRTPTNPEGLFAATQKALDTGVFNVYGSDYDTKDGTAVRDYIHVDDLTDAIVRAVEEPAAMSDYEPLGSGRSYTVLEYVTAFREINNLDFEVRFVDRRAGDLERSEVPWMSKFIAPKKTLNDIVKL